MTIFTHLLATTAGVQAMGLKGREAVLAYVFGVAVDIDHLIKLPFYLKTVGLRNEKGYYWRSSLQEPVAFLWIVPLSLFLESPVPVIFFAIHLLMDYAVRYEKMPWYPYRLTITRGWLLGFSDAAKEVALVAFLVCSNLFLYFKRV